MRNGPITRFAITETTVVDSKVVSSESTEAESAEAEEKEEETVKPKPDSSVTSRSDSDAESGKICPQCGRVTASDAKFCVYCGGPL